MDFWFERFAPMEKYDIKLKYHKHANLCVTVLKQNWLLKNYFYESFNWNMLSSTYN